MVQPFVVGNTGVTTYPNRARNGPVGMTPPKVAYELRDELERYNIFQTNP